MRCSPFAAYVSAAPMCTFRAADDVGHAVLITCPLQNCKLRGCPALVYTSLRLFLTPGVGTLWRVR